MNGEHQHADETGPDGVTGLEGEPLPSGPGLVVLARPDPPSAARDLAARLDAELAESAEELDQALSVREEAWRATEHRHRATEAERLTALAAQGDPETDAEVVRRARADDDSAGTAPVVPADVERLRELAQALTRAERIRDRTAAQFPAALERRLSTSTGLALHHSALEQAAAAVTDATRALQAADAALAALDGGESWNGTALGAEPPSDLEWGAADWEEPEEDDPGFGPHEEPLPDLDLSPQPTAVPVRRDRAVRSARGQALGVVAMAAGLGLLLIGTRSAPWEVAVLLPIVALGWGVAMMVRARRQAEERSDRERATSALASATADRAPVEAPAAEPQAEPDWPAEPEAELDWSATTSDLGASTPGFSPTGDDALDQQRIALRLEREEAAELLRSAERAWVALAGPDADPHDIDQIVRQHDPQRTFAEGWADQSPTLRTVSALHRRARARWRVAWAVLDRDAPPLEAADAAIEALAAEGRDEEEHRDLLSRAAEAEERIRAREELPELLGGRRLYDLLAEIDAHAPGDEARRRALVAVDPFAGMDDQARTALENRLRDAADSAPVVAVVSG